MEPVVFKTLDARCLTMCFDELVSPQTLRQICGEGMPKTSAGDVSANPAIKLMVSRDLPKGDMYVRFDIVFPTNLTKAQRSEILESLA